MLKKAQELKRKKRRDAGTPIFTKRDANAFRWLGEQYVVRLDQLQRLLGEEEILSVGGTQKVVARWERLGWVKVEHLRGEEPVWVWSTQRGLQMVRLPYGYRNMEHSLNELSHLYAINEVRLEWEEEAERWVSERSLWHDVRWEKGKDQLHRPDGELHFSDGQIVAIEVELSQKRPAMLSENLIELIRGEQYLQLKEKHGATEARQKSVGMESRYDEIWYFGPKEVRRQVMRERGKLLEQGVLSEEEANHLFVRWYPLASVEEQEQEEQEDKEGLVSWQKAVSQEKHRRTKTADRRRKKA